MQTLSSERDEVSENGDPHDFCDGDLILHAIGVWRECAHRLFYDVANLALVYGSLSAWIRDDSHLHSSFEKCWALRSYGQSLDLYLYSF